MSAEFGLLSPVDFSAAPFTPEAALAAVADAPADAGQLDTVELSAASQNSVAAAANVAAAAVSQSESATSYGMPSQVESLGDQAAAWQTQLTRLDGQQAQLQALAPSTTGMDDRPVGIRPGGDYLGLYQDAVDMRTYMPDVPRPAPPPYTSDMITE